MEVEVKARIQWMGAKFQGSFSGGASGKSEKFLICTYRTYCCLSAIGAN